MKPVIIPILGFCLILMCSCRKDDPKPMPDERYPYTYHALSPLEWDQLKSEFDDINNNDSLHLTKFGFVAGKIFLVLDTIEDDQVISCTEQLIDKYSLFLGIKSKTELNVPESLTAYDLTIGHGMTTNVFDYFKYSYPHAIGQEQFWAEFHEYEYVREPFLHHFWIPQNTLQGTKLHKTRIQLLFNESDTSMEVMGNWFPEALIPSDQIYTQEEAIRITSYAFKDDLECEKLMDTNLFETNVIRCLYPLRCDERIEIHECWRVTSYYGKNNSIFNAYIDTQTGEILQNWISFPII